MKRIKSPKKSTGKNQAQELYPKVKTFSKAYDFAPKTEETPVVPSRNLSNFALDERPYPTDVPPVYYPEIPNKSSDFNDPDRIDLQDTLLTDESFMGRPPKQSDTVLVDSAEIAPAGNVKPEEDPAIEENSGIRDAEEAEEDPAAEEEDNFWKAEKTDPPAVPEDNETDKKSGPFFGYEPEEDEVSDSFYSPEPECKPESPCETDPEAEYEADLFYKPDEDVNPVQDTESKPVLFPDSAPENKSVLPGKSEKETGKPFSWFDSDEDLMPEDSAGIAFKKQKYTARVGKKKNLRKRLRIKPSGSLKWKSSNTKIAKVSRKGILKPKKKGKVTVRVKAKNGERAKVKILITSSKKKKKQKVLPWESVGTEKKAVPDKKWARFA